MIRRSLKLRLAIIQGVTILIALGITGWGITYLFDRYLERRIGSELDTYISQIVSRITFDVNGVPNLKGQLADPRFGKIYSGLYWQIYNETSKHLARSRSLWDTQLTLPTDIPDFGKIHIHNIDGPDQSTLLIHERRLLFKSAAGEQAVRIVVALDLQDLEEMREEFSYDVAAALFVLGITLLLAGWVQITIGLVPLSRVGKSLAAIRTGKASRISEEFSVEISPLVDEVNDLLSKQEAAIEAAKNRANNLAHGFKTPLTALGSDVARLRKHGEDKIAADIEATALLMRRQIDKELTTARIRDVSRMPCIDVMPTILGIVATLKRTPFGEDIDFNIECSDTVLVQMDKDDLAEILGNLLENATRYAARKIDVRVYQRSQEIIFEIDDDGPGISEKMRQAVLQRGVYLDRSGSSTGLGLAIVNDVLGIYGVTLTLGMSALGGLQASFSLPATE